MLLIANHSANANCSDISNEIFANNSCTKIKTFKSSEITVKPILVIVLHGDSPNKKPDYHYEFAKTVTDNSTNVVAIGMLRPGYSDLDDRTSDGEKGSANGDSYDSTRTKQIAIAIIELKKIHSPSKIILAGHSGGSAITANIMSLYPNLIDYAFMVSCPCDVNAWRKDMLNLSKKPVFQGDIETLSPLNLVEYLNESSIISMFVGKNDRITKPYINERYKQAALKSGANITLEVIEGKHDIFLNPLILDAMTTIINSYNTTTSITEEKIMKAIGEFQITMEPQKDTSTPAGRMTISKVYSGGLVGTGTGQMISKRTENGASVYSAIEEFEGTLDGKKGAFTLFHTGFMSASKQELKVIIVEGSGRGDLHNIKGELSINQDNGQHQYELKYSL